MEAIYILGDFGVKLPNVVCMLPEKLKRGDVTVQGFPYYSGGIRYHTGIAEGKVLIAFKNLFCFSVKNLQVGKKKDKLRSSLIL